MKTLVKIAKLRRGLPADEQHRLDQMLRHSGAGRTLTYLEGLRSEGERRELQAVA